MTDQTTSGRVSAGGVTYEKVDDSYFEKRGLKRSAGVWGL
jgi:ethanolamine permease